MLLIVLVPILVFGMLVVVVLALSGSGNNFAHQLAAIDASAGAPEDRESNILRRLLDDDRRNRMEGRLSEAGWYNVTPAQMVRRAFGAGIFGMVFGVLLLIVLKHASPVFLIFSALLAICAAYFPYYQLNKAVETRKKEIHRALPDFLDLLSTTVEAGTALNGAIATAADGLHGALGDELRAALHDIRLGRSRAEALAAMAQRAREPDLTTIVTTLVQSERLGANIATMLAQLAAESREARILHAEEIGATLSNKLVFPMALFMLPALLIIIFGGVAVKILAHK